MKQYKNIWLLAGFIALSGATAMAQAPATAACKGCGAAKPPVSLFDYVAETQRYYLVGNCIPGSDVQLYSSPRGGKVAATAVADDKGEARFSLAAGVPVAFAINHSRSNAQGVKGSGKVIPVQAPALVIEHLQTEKINNAVQLSWNAGITTGDWVFAIQRSTGNGLFSDIATVDARTVKTVQGYAFTDKDAAAATSLFYRVEARSAAGQKAATAAMAVKLNGKSIFAVQPTLFDNSVQVTVPADCLPATYTISDIAGRSQLAVGVINAVGQNIRLNLAPGTYALQVTNKQGKSSAQLIFKK